MLEKIMSQQERATLDEIIQCFERFIKGEATFFAESAICNYCANGINTVVFIGFEVKAGDVEREIFHAAKSSMEDR